MLKEEIKEFKCNDCRGVYKDYNFYKLIKEKLNDVTQKYEPYIICKNCIKNMYSEFLSNNSKAEGIYNICKMFNLYYDFSLIASCNCIGEYIGKISSLPQYKGLEFKDFKLTSKDKAYIMSDLEFLEHDISEIKIRISNALSSNDVNQHGKWLNSLREALELRNKLKDDNNKRKDVVTNFNVNIDGSSIENINNEVIKELMGNLNKKEIKQPMYTIENNSYGLKISDINRGTKPKYQIKDEQGRLVGMAKDIEWINPM